VTISTLWVVPDAVELLEESLLEDESLDEPPHPTSAPVAPSTHAPARPFRKPRRVKLL
jgi:hypothetical protein